MATEGNPEIARRVRAARALAGLDSVQALADAIGQRGLSTKTLRAIEQARRIAEPRELAAIADACGLSTEFFRMDLSAGASESRLAGRVGNAESQLASLWEAVTQIRHELGAVRLQTDRLTRQSLERHERQAVEQDTQRRRTSSGNADAEDGR